MSVCMSRNRACARVHIPSHEQAVAPGNARILAVPKVGLPAQRCHHREANSLDR